MFIDCTLDELKVPGFSGVNPPFGTKKPDGESVTAREADVNIRMPFSRQRPYHVGETSVTSEVEAHSAFVLETAGITLTLGEGGFIGCAVKGFNVSDGATTVVWGGNAGERAEIKPKTVLELEWSGTAWRKTSGTLSGGDNLAVMVDGCGRNLFDVFGITAGTQAQKMAACMAEIRRRCNNNGEIDGTGIPDFTGIMLGDYMDGLDLSAIPAENSGTAGQAWKDTYKNNRIVVSGFNTYKGTGDTENTKNHILFTFRNVPLRKRMNASETNSGGYAASELRAFLEGTNGNGTGNKSGVTTAAFMNALKAQLAGGGSENYLYTIRKAHSTKSGEAWNNYTVFLLSELEAFGYPCYGDEGVYMAAITSPSIAARAGFLTNIHIPIFQKSYEYLIKRYNGARDWHWLQTPHAASAGSFCRVSTNGNTGHESAVLVGGCAPAFCAA
jgi:hypothetical protein